MTKMATQIETTIFDHTGVTPESVTVKVMTQSAAAYAEVLHNAWQHHGWREELFTVADNKTVQCLYDSDGIIWQVTEYTDLDKQSSGQPIN